jgi:NADH-quinone oxidoreductase subunit I
MSSALEALKALATGYATTFKHLFRKPITEEYPEYKRQLPERTRARIILTRDPDGGERCVACYLCSAVCPVSCISICRMVPNQLCQMHLLWPLRGSLSDSGNSANTDV